MKELLNSIYLNSFSLGSFIAVVGFFMAAFFLLGVKNRTMASKQLGIAYLLIAIFNIGLFISATIYHPISAYHRWITVFTILAAEINFAAFFFYFPDEKAPRAAKFFLYTGYAVAVACTAAFAVVSFKSGKVYRFSGHYWDFDADVISTTIGLVIIALILTSLILCIWRTNTHRGRERWTVLIMGIIFLISTVLPAILNAMCRDGLIAREVFNNSWVLINVVGFFILLVYYINNSKDRFSFMGKLIGISLVTFLAMLQIISYFLLMEKERSFDDLHDKKTSLVLDHPQRREGAKYFVTYLADRNEFRFSLGGGTVYIEEHRSEFRNTLIWQRIRELPQRDFKQNLERILNVTPSHFKSYADMLREHASTIPDEEADPAGKLLNYAESFKRDIIYSVTKLRNIPEKDFNTEASIFAKKKREKIFPFYDALEELLAIGAMDGADLKRAALDIFTLLSSPSSRHYRVGRDGETHYIGYMQVDPASGAVREAGFPYTDYRAFMHATVLKFMIILLVTMVIVRFGFQLFLWRILIKPLRSLLHGVREVDNGNMNVTLPIMVEDEFGVFTRNFNQMVTTIKDANIEIENHTKNLESMVENRTEELKFANIELSRSNEKLKEIDTLKSNFFANISHEIRTPLTLILSPVESALQGDYKEGVDETFLKNIQKNAIRLLRLINNLLDFSKIEAGKMKLHIKEVDVVKTIKNYISILKSTADSKGINVSVNSEKDSILLFIDIEKFDRIGMNVFSNALKFTEKGGRIEIRIKDDETNCYIEIEDSGIGIPADKLNTIFDRFSQVDISSTRQYEGTGIGLSLAKELIELSGGCISVTSRFIEEYPDDHGTIFTLSFPKGNEFFAGRNDVEFITVDGIDEAVNTQRRFTGVREMVELRKSTTEVERKRIEDKTPSTFEKQRTRPCVLVVEDNADMRDFLYTILDNHYTVHCAVDGKEGFDIIEKLNPDMIVTDVMMPNIDGYTMTRMIKEDDRFKRIPILMLTAKADIAHKIEGLEYGADEYITKPFNSKELLVRMKSLLKSREYEKEIEERKNEIEAQLEVARLLQRKLLPEKIPQITGYRSHVIYTPMDRVGGDFYDIKANDDVIELFIADVSGHGIHGAFISMITKMAFESIRERNTPRSVLYILNDIICRSTVQSNFVTVLYCIIKRDTNTLMLSNAGHLPILIFRQQSDEFIEVRASGFPLGLSKDLQLEENEIQLKKGDRILLYTDGITECTNADNKQFGDEDFSRFIRSNRELEPEKFTATLLSTLRSFSGKDYFDDDMCLIVFDVM